ncbi:MAG: Na-translocating system protein MpsC family protein [Heyndrickxia sp.]
MVNPNLLENISSYTSKLLRKNFGRGPQSCHTTLCRNHLITYLQGFVSPMEEILLQQGQMQHVDVARSMILNHLLDELKGVVQVSLQVEVEEYYHDWNFPNNSGILIFCLEKELDVQYTTEIDIPTLEAEISRISYLVQKTPNEIHTFPISPSIYLIERKGILVQIEKALIEKGFQKELLFTKDELEKKYFHRDGRFADIFHSDVKDFFVSWNLKEDKSMMAFILN